MLQPADQFADKHKYVLNIEFLFFLLCFEFSPTNQVVACCRAFNNRLLANTKYEVPQKNISTFPLIIEN